MYQDHCVADVNNQWPCLLVNQERAYALIKLGGPSMNEA